MRSNLHKAYSPVIQRLAQLAARNSAARNAAERNAVAHNFAAPLLALLLTGALLFTFPAKGLSQCADPSDIYGFEFNGAQYEIVMEMKTWGDAALCAVERGGYLAEINSQEEQDAIMEAIRNGAEISDTYTEVLNGGGIAYIWIGATDTDDEGVWRWEGEDKRDGAKFWTGQGANGDNDGTPFEDSYVNWGGTGEGTPQEPDDFGPDGQDFGAIGLSGWPKGSTMLGNTGEWNDLEGTSTIYFIIEYDPVVGTGDSSPFGPGRGTGNPNTLSVRLYPNPSEGVVYLGTSGDQRSGADHSVVDHSVVDRLELFDFTGRLLDTYLEFPADLTRHGKGVFLTRIYTARGVVTQKLLVR